MTEFLEALGILTTTPGGILVLIIVLVFTGGMIWLVRSSNSNARETARMLGDLLKELAATNAKQAEATDKVGDAMLASNQLQAQTQEALDQSNIKLGQDHVEVLENVADVKAAVVAGNAEVNQRLDSLETTLSEMITKVNTQHTSQFNQMLEDVRAVKDKIGNLPTAPAETPARVELDPPATEAAPPAA